MATDHYLPWADYIRVIALVLVIVLHSAAVYVIGWGVFPLSWWVLANSLDSLTRVAVPLFVMLSGSLLLPKSEPAVHFYGKRLTRVVLPWLFWASMVFGTGLVQHGTYDLVQKPVSTLFHAYVTSYWYVALLLVLYLVTPLLRWLVGRWSVMRWWGIASAMLITASLLSWWFEVADHPRLVQLAWLVAFGGYFVLGYLVRSWHEQGLLVRWRWWLLGLAVMSWLLTMVGTWWLTEQQRRFIQLFYDYGFSPVILQGGATFALLLTWSEQLEGGMRRQLWLHHLVQQLGKLSYGIFLTQSWVSALLLQAVLAASVIQTIHPLVVITGLSVATLVVCYGLTWFCSRLPVLRLTV